MRKLNLAEVVGDRVELGLDVGAKARQCANDNDRDQAGDEAVFDGRRTRLVLDKAGKKLVHDSFLVREFKKSFRLGGGTKPTIRSFCSKPLKPARQFATLELLSS